MRFMHSGFSRLLNCFGNTGVDGRRLASSLVLALPRETKWALAVCCDLFLFWLSIWLAFCIRLDEFIPLNNEVWISVSVAAALGIPIFSIFGLYRAVFRWPGSAAFQAIFKANMCYGGCFFLTILFLKIEGVPRTIGIVQPLIMVFLVLGTRSFVGFVFGKLIAPSARKKSGSKALIYGAGYGGRELMRALSKNKNVEVYGLIDDNPQIIGRSVEGLIVFSPDSMGSLIADKKITHVFVAIPSATETERDRIIGSIVNFNVAVKVMPSLASIVSGRSEFLDFDQLYKEHLLGRARVEPMFDLMASRVTGNSILVTGAGGSIGSEICRQLISIKPSIIVLFDNSELALYSLASELDTLRIQKDRDSKIRIIPVLGSVQDSQTINRTFAEWKPDIIYHAAAYKHVPLVEANLVEGFKNNVFGTWNLAVEAVNAGVSDFVFISTDKAVRPTNVMGATKRLAEMILQCMHIEFITSTRFSMVRFGNVLASSGSVIPKFREQMRRGGPITVTDFRVTRYFMAITEAAQLVIQAGGLAKGGDLFLLDMGEPVRITDLAKKMIRLSGFTEKSEVNPDGDIEIIEVGLRPGEKLYEELLIGGTFRETVHPKIMTAEEGHLAWVQLEQELKTARLLIEQGDTKAVFAILRSLVKEYSPGSDLAEYSKE